MPGAGKKRGKIDRKNQPGPPEDDSPPAGQASGGYDGSPSGPQSGPSSGRGRQESVGQSARSASREPSAARGAAGPQTLKDPARDYPMILNKNVDFAGNAYNLISQVSRTISSCRDLLFFHLRKIIRCLIFDPSLFHIGVVLESSPFGCAVVSWSVKCNKFWLRAEGNLGRSLG